MPIPGGAPVPSPGTMFDEFARLYARSRIGAGGGPPAGPSVPPSHKYPVAPQATWDTGAAADLAPQDVYFPDAGMSIPVPRAAARDMPPNPGRPTVTMDTTRGLSGADWIASQAPSERTWVSTADAPNLAGYEATRAVQEDLRRGRLEDLDFRAKTRASDLADVQTESAMKLAELQGSDPMGYATLMNPERMKQGARLDAGMKVFQMLQPLAEQRAQVRNLLTRLKAEHPEATSEIAALEERDRRLTGSVRMFQQAMGFGMGQTPSVLYQQDPFSE